MKTSSRSEKEPIKGYVHVINFGQSTTFLFFFTWLILKWATTKFVSPIKHHCRDFSFAAIYLQCTKISLKSDCMRRNWKMNWNRKRRLIIPFVFHNKTKVHQHALTNWTEVFESCVWYLKVGPNLFWEFFLPRNLKRFLRKRMRFRIRIAWGANTFKDVVWMKRLRVWMHDHSAFCTCHLVCFIWIGKCRPIYFYQNTVQKSNHVQVNKIDKNCLKNYNFHRYWSARLFCMTTVRSVPVQMSGLFELEYQLQGFNTLNDREL